MKTFNEKMQFKPVQLPALDPDDSKRHTMIDLKKHQQQNNRLTSTFQRTKSILGGQQIETGGEKGSSHAGGHNFNLDEDFNNTLQQKNQPKFQRNIDSTFDMHFRQTNTFKSPIKHIDEQFTSNMNSFVNNSPMNLTASNFRGQRTNSISLFDTHTTKN